MFSNDNITRVIPTGIENADNPDANTYCIIGAVDPNDYLFDGGYYSLKLIYKYEAYDNDTLEVFHCIRTLSFWFLQ